jgi:hypothetical protein
MELEISMYFGGVLKFLATFMGLKSASSNFPCVSLATLQKNFQLLMLIKALNP